MLIARTLAADGARRAHLTKDGILLYGPAGPRQIHAWRTARHGSFFLARLKTLPMGHGVIHVAATAHARLALSAASRIASFPDFQATIVPHDALVDLLVEEDLRPQAKSLPLSLSLAAWRGDAGIAIDLGSHLPTILLMHPLTTPIPPASLPIALLP